MYTYKPHPMTDREKEAVLISLTIRAMVKFQKVLASRLQECNNSQWQRILKEVKDEVTEALLVRTDLKLIMQYTKELEAMDVSEFFPKPKLQPAPVAIDYEQRRQMEKDHMLGHPTGERIFSFRRRTRNNKPDRDRYQHQMQVA